jgi:Ca2+-binding EF-hand superfamily protein
MDNSGTIDKKELFMCLMMNGIYCTPREVQGWMDRYDTDGRF